MDIAGLLEVVSELPFGGNNATGWETWPFGPGYGEGWGPTVARFAFVAVIFAAISIFLRVLFGPGGPLRDPEIDEEAAELRAKELASLEDDLAKGRISEEQYKWRKKRI